ncbi:MAG: C4-dicarboxylate ABC transporter substrate-binding protein, partial [Verrucomicrobiota bacterium]|nr:C4-dicarboxylate ABC transporter substrate-binding protein [Verrucomicrobiota bacterium]
PYVYQADLCVISFAVVMNKARYEALPEDVRQVLDALYSEQAEWTGAYVDGHVQEALAWSKENHGLKVSAPSDGDRAALRATAQPLIEEYVARVAAKGVDGRAVVDFIRERLR